MGKTYKYVSEDVHRNPKGKKRAAINNARKRSIPPNAWDDLAFDPAMYIPYKVILTMVDKGLDQTTIINKVHKKFRLPKPQIINMVRAAKKKQVSI